MILNGCSWCIKFTRPRIINQHARDVDNSNIWGILFGGQTFCMNTKRPPDHHDEPLLPELEPPPDALTGGSELLDDDEAGAAAAATYLERSIFTPPDTSFFNLPVFYHFRQRPYHRVDVQGPFDTRRLAHDYSQHLYRSEVTLLQAYKPAIE